MTKQDLIELGFRKVKVSSEESGDKPYHYYIYEFGDLYNGVFSLFSSDSDMAKKDGEWKVELFEGNLKPFKNKSHVKQYIKVMEKLVK